MFKFIFSSIVLGLVVGMNSCKTQEKAMTSNNNNISVGNLLINNEWQIIKTVETKENASELVYKKPYNFSLNLETGNASIRLEANKCHSKYTLSEDKTTISFSPFRCTKMCCDSKEGTGLIFMLTDHTWLIETANDSTCTFSNQELGVKVYLEKAAQIDEEFKQ